jgi:hypothetical protein
MMILTRASVANLVPPSLSSFVADIFQFFPRSLIGVAEFDDGCTILVFEPGLDGLEAPTA